MSDLSLLASRKPPFRSQIKRSGNNTAIRCWRTLGDSAEARRRPNGRSVAAPGKFAQRYKIPRASAPEAMEQPGRHLEQVSIVYKFGGSSLASAERMREVARIVCSEQDHFPCVVLSAMGKTTNTLLEAGEAAISTAAESIPQLSPVRKVKELHRETAVQLEADPDTTAAVERLLEQLEQLLTGISIMQDLTPRAKDSLVSFGERLSTRLFAAYLRSQGVGAKQYDAWDLGFTTTDEFTNADIVYESTLPQIKNVLHRDSDSPRELPIVTGFLGRGKDTKAITTLGRGGSDLSATVIGLALGVPEVQVWKDVDGVLSCDPRIVPEAVPVSTITYEEATELAYFGAQVLHPQAMLPAQRSGGKLCVRVRNSYNRAASGSVITHSRDMQGALLTSIVLKDNITMLDIVSTRMLGQHGFLSRVFDIFRSKEISVDVVATSEISVSLTLDPSRIWSRDLIDEELSDLIAAFTDRQIADVRCRRGMSIISLICNIERTSELLQRVFMVLADKNIQVRMMSQGASKTNISLIVDADVAKGAIQAIHQEFFR